MTRSLRHDFNIVRLLTIFCCMPQKMSKVKASDKLSFSLHLDLAPFLVPDGPTSAAQSGSMSLQDTEYELMSILIHKGPSASHGHYGEQALPWPHAGCCSPPSHKLAPPTGESRMLAIIMGVAGSH